MEEFRSLDERFSINLKGVVYDKQKDKYYRNDGNYIQTSCRKHFNKSKSVYKVWQKELEDKYKEHGYKLVCDYEPKFSRKFMINSSGEVVNIERGQKVLAKRHGKHMLWENGKESSIHILVYKVFVGEIKGQVCHKDGDKFNNNVDNLYLNGYNCV